MLLPRFLILGAGNGGRTHIYSLEGCYTSQLCYTRIVRTLVTIRILK